MINDLDSSGFGGRLTNVLCAPDSFRESLSAVEAAAAMAQGVAHADPTRATSYGTGQLIAAAGRKGCETIVVCIGGSGTVDGGMGIAQALGGRFFDRGLGG